MSSLYLYADSFSREILSNSDGKIIIIGGDFGYGNFGDILQHKSAVAAVKNNGEFRAISVFAANAISHVGFPEWTRECYSTDAVIFVAEYPLILSDSDPQLELITEIKNISGLHLYGGGFLNSMWGEFVLSVVEFFLNRAPEAAYFASGQQVSAPFHTRVLEHLRHYHPSIFGVRDESSLQLLGDSGFRADYSFDDATEELLNLTKEIGLRYSKGLCIHINSSDYTANVNLQHGLGRELNLIANSRFSKESVTLLQAFRDTRQEVFDSIETIKRLDYLYPFQTTNLVNLVGLISEPVGHSPHASISGELGYSCSYHVALWLQLSGIPCWLRSANQFYDQKSRALQVTQGLEEFIREPKLADHRFNLERRDEWNQKFEAQLSNLVVRNNLSKFSSDRHGPAPWPFFYKGNPTLQEKLQQADTSLLFKSEELRNARAELEGANAEVEGLRKQLETLFTSIREESKIVADDKNALAQLREENSSLQLRIEMLTAKLAEIEDSTNRDRRRAEDAEYQLARTSAENADLIASLHGFASQLTKVGDSAHWHRQRADDAEYHLTCFRSENSELRSQLDTSKIQLANVLASRSWRLTHSLRWIKQRIVG